MREQCALRVAMSVPFARRGAATALILAGSCPAVRAQQAGRDEHGGNTPRGQHRQLRSRDGRRRGRVQRIGDRLLEGLERQPTCVGDDRDAGRPCTLRDPATTIAAATIPLTCPAAPGSAVHGAGSWERRRRRKAPRHAGPGTRGESLSTGRFRAACEPHRARRLDRPLIAVDCAPSTGTAAPSRDSRQTMRSPSRHRSRHGRRHGET